MKTKLAAVVALIIGATLLLLEPVRTLLAPSEPSEESLSDEFPNAVVSPEPADDEPPMDPPLPQSTLAGDESGMLVSHQWSEILASLQAQPDLETRSAAVVNLLKSIPDSELPAALAYLETQTGAAASELRAGLVRRWAENDAPAAAAWAAQLTDASQAAEVLPQIAIAWANANLSAAASWTAGLPESSAKEAALLGLAYEAARSDPVTALKTAAMLSPTAERDSLVVHAFSQWVATDPAAASAWAETVPDASLRERLLGTAAIAFAKQDGQAAATFTAEALGAGPEQERAAVGVVQRWAEESPEAAAAWTSQFPDSPARQSALEWLEKSATPLIPTQ